MLTRVGHYFLARDGESAPIESRYLERDGYCVVKQAFSSQQVTELKIDINRIFNDCLLYTSPSPRDRTRSRMPSSA